jgi:hypothetical protein
LNGKKNSSFFAKKWGCIFRIFFTARPIKKSQLLECGAAIKTYLKEFRSGALIIFQLNNLNKN